MEFIGTTVGRALRNCALGIACTVLVWGAALAADEVKPQTLITNVNVFDGRSEKLAEGMSVLIEGNLIKRIAQGEIEAVGAAVIDGGGRTLMPGLIDSHVHLTHMILTSGLSGFEGATWEELGGIAAASAREFIMSGFTTVRDMGGMGTGLKRVIDRGDLAGPRIYAAGSYISQTAGHGDLRLRSTPNASRFGMQMSSLERLRIIRLADGVPEVLNATRENFADGAAYIKIMAGGGVTSEKDPLHTLQYTPPEILAAVESAANWDTYVAVHIYQANGIKRALKLGVKCIDHGHFIDEEAMAMIKEKGAFLSTNFAAFSDEALRHPVYGDPTGPQYPKMLQFDKARDTFLALARKHKPKMVFNSDVVLSDRFVGRANRDFQMYLHAEWFGNFEALKSLTSVPGQLAQLTGKNNPYPGKLGVIEEGAYADIILVDGNPLTDMSVLGANPELFDAKPRGETIESIRVIMKDGKIYKNTL
jgi:imidazolonepropionase-like amidohydrolase